MEITYLVDDEDIVLEKQRKIKIIEILLMSAVIFFWNWLDFSVLVFR